VDGLAPNFQELSESPRILRPLDRLVLEVTVYCNLKCKMCSVWEVREHGVPLPLAKLLLADAYRLGARSFVPYGAESFMRKDFVDMVEHAHAIGYELQPIVTNGTMISEENLERLSRCPSVKLSISIDGPRAVHDELRGAGNFDKSVATARECVRRGIGVIFTGVIMRETLEHLPFLIDLAGDVGIKEVSYQPFNTFISGPSKDIARFSLRSVERDAIAAALTKLGEYAHRRRILIYTEAMFELMPDYLAYGKQPIPRGGCKLPSTMLLVDWRGDVYPCFFMAEAPDRMGNVYRDRLDEIWHSRIHKQLQILALTERCPGCLANCSDVQTYTDDAHQLSISKT
jgi:radical SAM protein with 4Fe4S-binding SPASM domain